MTQNPFASPDRPPARHFALLPAAGSGTRFGTARPKQYERLAGVGSGQGGTVLEQAVTPFLAAGWFEAVVVVVQAHDLIAAQLPGLCVPGVYLAPVGGASRRDSVLAGLKWLRQQLGAQGDDWVHVHDAARPGLPVDRLEAIYEVIGATMGGGIPVEPVCGALLALPVVDTLKCGPQGQSERTVDREGLWLAQTPQTFRLQPLLDALERHPQVTDEASAMEAQGHRPVLVAGSRLNAKITTVEDLLVMTRLLAPAMPALRIGQGWDVHALVPGRPLRIGGVLIPHARGLLGHSDADVLLHAITDALLGAAGLGDIGQHFPDTDPAYRGADSLTLLAQTLERVSQAGWKPINLDCTVVAQAPRLAEYRPAMVKSIAAVLQMDPGAVNVKAKTSERLGSAGRGESISAQAVVLLGRYSA